MYTYSEIGDTVKYEIDSFVIFQSDAVDNTLSYIN